MQRLTDIWRGLIGGTQTQAAAMEQEREQQEREVHLGEAYRHLYWTRVVRIDSDQDTPIN